MNPHPATNFDALLDEAAADAKAYLHDLADRRVAPSPAALEGLTAFDEPMPAGPSDPAETLRLLHRAGSPATMATAGGRFFGLVVGSALPASVAAGWLLAAWDQIAFDATTSPVVARIEAITSRWLLDLFGLPRESTVSFVTGATIANFTCLAAARGELLRRQGWDVEADGLFGAPRLRVIVSEETHVTVLKALSMLGLGRARVERVPVDRQGRMIASALPPLDETCVVAAQAGNVNSGSFDPIADIASRAEGTGAWIHVDGAFGLWAAASPRHAHLTAGIDRVDSCVTDGHKWLNTPYDSGFAFCRHPDAVRRALTTTAAYLPGTTGLGTRDLAPEFSKRARGVEAWAALRSLGRGGVADLIGRCCAHATRLADGLRGQGFTILNDVVINQVAATIGDPAQLGEIVQRVQAGGECWFGPTRWQGRDAFRLSVSSWKTTEDDIERTLRAITAARDAVLGSGR